MKYIVTLTRTIVHEKEVTADSEEAAMLEVLRYAPGEGIPTQAHVSVREWKPSWGQLAEIGKYSPQDVKDALDRSP